MGWVVKFLYVLQRNNLENAGETIILEDGTGDEDEEEVPCRMRQSRRGDEGEES